MVRSPAKKWLLLPLALVFATALATPQLLFLGYDLRGLLDRDRPHPLSPPPDGLFYAFGDGPEWLAVGGSLYPADKLGYEIEGL